MNRVLAFERSELGAPVVRQAAQGVAAAFLILLAGIAIPSIPSARAQSPSVAQPRFEAPALAESMVTQKPDVQVVVAPLGTGAWGISEVYPGSARGADVQRRFVDLGRASGWRLATGAPVTKSLGPTRRDHQSLDVNGEDADIPGNVAMSSISGTTSDPVVDLAGGSINLAPFLYSLRDLDHVNLLYLIPRGTSFPFHGIKTYEDSHIGVHLKVGQGTYVYAVNIKDHGLTPEILMALPKYQNESTPAPSAPTEPGQGRVYATGLVIGLAVGAGLLVYLWAMRLGGGSRRDNRG